ncbi:hypothetical protein FA95DRAFT_910833 [Auriscalpium vulgare]|uniref:Uncharacterized protein n=1 Tax=Auriscalpium vulgare TaxID=40419 RepID=A0ACB8R8I9_9AGAM|nr:hypothetical protein FA95DRAFT_910833 [Auriscalpium vulgare]
MSELRHCTDRRHLAISCTIFLLEKFVTLSRALFTSIVADEDVAHVFEVSPHEQDIIKHTPFENLRDGLIILQASDKINPGSVVWRRVSKSKGGGISSPKAQTFGEDEEEVAIGVTPNQSTLSKFKQVENTNYGRGAGQAQRDTPGGYPRRRHSLVLGLVRQLMRMNITKTLSSLSGSGRPISDTEMLKWANTTAQKGKPSAKTPSGRSRIPPSPLACSSSTSSTAFSLASLILRSCSMLGMRSIARG